MFRSLLGLASDEPPPPEPQRGLPASWYRSPAMYQLERRAIFSRRWLLATHALRLAEPGAFVTLTVAGYALLLVRDRDPRAAGGGRVRGFHNVCRHRAFPVERRRCGTARVLACRYHGWSYGLAGGLAKAPRFDAVAGFDRALHGLLPVHVRVDRAGFVWVNLEAAGAGADGDDGAEPGVRWEEQLRGVDGSDRMRMFDFADEFAYDHEWDMDLDANWKGLVENYNECYHCPTSHPLIAGVSDLSRYRVEPNGEGILEHEIVNKDEGERQFRRTIIYFYPGTSVTITENMFYIQRMIPVTATTSKIENEVYRHKNATDDEFAKINAFYHQVLEEDKELCVGAQRNINAGVYVNGEYHPEKEKGPLHFQATVRKDVMEHRKKEDAQGGQEIWPAVPKQARGTLTTKLVEEEAFCSKLESESCPGVRPELVW